MRPSLSHICSSRFESIAQAARPLGYRHDRSSHSGHSQLLPPSSLAANRGSSDRFDLCVSLVLGLAATDPLQTTRMCAGFYGKVCGSGGGALLLVRWLSLALSIYSNDLTTWLDCPSTLPDTRSPPSSQMVFGDSPTRSCAERWAAPIHQLTCDYVFPPHYDEDRAKHLPPPELATAQYYGRIQGDKVIERLLAQAGLRLASSLNLLLGGPRSASESSVNFDWLEEAEKRY